MAVARVADMTVEELKGIIAEVVNEQLRHWMSDLNATPKEKMVELTEANSDSGYYQLPRLTEAEQMQRNLAAIELLRKWTEEGDEEEQRETLEYLQKALKEKIAELTESNSDPGYYQLPRLTEAEQMQKNQFLIEWYRKWAEEGDEEEQRETLEYLQKALDEDRLSNRPLFAQQ